MNLKLITANLLLAALASANPIWLEWSGSAGGPLTGSFPGGGITGSATATSSNAIDGTTNGVVGPTASSFTNLTGTFITHYGNGNPGTGLTTIGNPFNDTGDRYTVTMDFTGLSTGYLPAGSLFAFFDYDITESLEDLSAFAPGGSQINVAWLNAIAGTPGYLDANTSGGDESGAMSVPAPTWTLTGGVYQVFGNAGNMDSGFSVYRTTTNISTISYTHFLNTSTVTGGTGGGGIAIGSDVPEPGTWFMLLAGLTAIAISRHRQTA
jgi:hypothetical protein